MDFEDLKVDFAKRHDLVAWYEECEDGTIRLVWVKRGERGYYPIGTKTNAPKEYKPVFFDSPEEAEEYCVAINERLGLFSKEEMFKIVAASMVEDLQ